MPPGLDRPLVCPVLVGREADLAALGEVIREVGVGSGRTVLLSGEAGVGKTRLIGALCARATSDGFAHVLQGACFERDRSLPYAPFVDALRALVAGLSPVDAAGRVGADVAGLLPELGLPPVEDDPLQMRRRVVEGLVALLRRLAAPGPLVWVMEDLHWSDDSSLEAFAILARRLRHEPVLLVGTYRDDEVQPGLTALLSELDRARLSSSLCLSPLDRDEVGTMLRALLDLKRPPRAALVQQVFELTDGNPFFVEELLRSMLAGQQPASAGNWDRVYVDDVRLPRTIEEAVRRRTGLLGTAARQVVVRAAIMGRRFEFPVLASLTQLDHTALHEAIRELVDVQLVVEESEDQFAFRHALTRQAIQAQVLARERRVLHHQVAHALQECCPDDRLEELAYHFFAASDWPAAAAYAERAGDRARQLHATTAALEHFSNAVAAIERHGGVVPARLLRKRALVHETRGAFDAALADHTATLARAQADADRIAQCQALLDLGFLWSARDYARTGHYFRAGLAIARELGEPATLVSALNRIGNWYTNVERPAEGIDHHTEALTMAETLQDGRAIAQTLDLLALATCMLGRPASAVPLFDRAIGLHRELDDRLALISSLSIRALAGGGSSPWTTARCEPAALLEAVDCAEEALRLAQAVGWRAGECFAAHCLAEALAGRGTYARALEVARAGLEIAEEIRHEQWASALHFILGVMLRELGALEAARPHAEQALMLARSVGSAIWTHSSGGELIELYLQQGELGAAERLADSLLDAHAELPGTLSARLIRFGQAHLALRRGQPDAAAGLLAPLHASGTTPSLDLLQAEILLAQERPADAEQVLRRSIAWAETTGQRVIVWRLQALLARVLVGMGRGSDAQAMRLTAAARVEQIAVDVPESHRDEFRRLAHRALGISSPRVARDEAGLSPREHEVAILLGEGLSNRAIAERLVVGERTIESHVSAVLSKLNLSSRAQVAAWVARQRSS